ncbi:unnamed protein product [Owenia fusiformis]|uniref:EF-hand domain-containing protein n=1 Tax=Owenia fusiformis TaxID=6347 RepID=A0A8S4N7W0_OWEFU|nr:unnamed protein product [Owenia fusiformis]
MQSSTLIFLGVAIVLLGTVQRGSATSEALRVRLIEAIMKRLFTLDDSRDFSTQHKDIDISGVNEGLVLYKCFGTYSTDSIYSKYNELDVDNDGVVDQDEFVKGMDKYNCNANGKELFGIYDADDSGFLDSEEFRIALRQPMSDFKKKVVMDKFLTADTNSDGVYDSKDAIRTLDVSVMNFIRRIDANNDGKVTLQEFVDYWSRKLGDVEDDNTFAIKLHNAFAM